TAQQVLPSFPTRRSSDLDGQMIATWEVRLNPGPDAPMPGNGDVFLVVTHKPFTDADVFTFTTRSAAVDEQLASQQLQNIYVVPNPYVATSEIEPLNPIANTERGDRRLYFANLPQEATIRIYSLAGELIDTIEHRSTMDDGKAFWDLRTKENMNISYGLYIYHVDSPHGSFVGKFAVIK